MKLSDFQIQAPPRAKTLRDLSLIDFLALCDPHGDPLQAELIRRLNILRTRLNQVVTERASAYAQADDCQRRLDAAMSRINRLLDNLEE